MESPSPQASDQIVSPKSTAYVPFVEKDKPSPRHSQALDKKRINTEGYNINNANTPTTNIQSPNSANLNNTMPRTPSVATSPQVKSQLHQQLVVKIDSDNDDEESELDLDEEGNDIVPDESPKDAETDSVRGPGGCCSLKMYNILVLSFSLMFLFGAFNTIQSWATSILPGSLGSESLSTLYISVCISLFITPPLVHHFTDRLAIVYGAICYIVYMSSLIYPYTVTVLIASAINGFGASLLWVAVGGFLTKCSDASDRGRATGIFWSIFQLSLIGGNIVAFYALQFSYVVLFVTFSIIGVIGTCLLLLLRPFPHESLHPHGASLNDTPSPPSQQQILIDSTPPSVTNQRSHSARSSHHHTETYNMNVQGEEAPMPPSIPTEEDAFSPSDSNLSTSSVASNAAPASTFELLKAVYRLATTSTLLLLIPAFMFQGIEFSFWNGEFPQLFNPASLGLVLLWAGVGEATGGLSMGWLSDRVGRSLTWLLGSFVFLCGLFCLYSIKQDLKFTEEVKIADVSLLAYFAAFFFGLADSAINTQIYAMIGNKYKKDTPNPNSSPTHKEDEQRVVAAFTCFNFSQNVGSAIGFFYQPYWPVHGPNGTDFQLYVQLGLMMVAALGFIACDRGWFMTTKELEERDFEIRKEENEKKKQLLGEGTLNGKTNGFVLDGKNSNEGYKKGL